MKNIKYFIGGIVFYILAIPILESIVETISTGLEFIKGKVSIPVLKLSKDIQELQVDLEKHDEGVAMGFQYNGDEDEFYDEDDDFDDKKKSHIKIGFH